MTNIESAVLSQGVQINVVNVTSKLLTNAEILASPTVPIVIIPATPGTIHIPRWLSVLALNNALYTNIDGAAQMVFDWSAAPLGGNGMTGLQVFGSFNTVTGSQNEAAFQHGITFSGALMSRVGAAVVFKALNGALGNFTGGDAGNQWLVTITHQSFQVPRLLVK